VPPTDHASAQGETVRISWARLLKRVFDIDIEHCPNCGGTLKIIAAIEDPPVIVKIFSHLVLPARAPGAASRSIPIDLNKARPLANASRRLHEQPFAHLAIRYPAEPTGTIVGFSESRKRIDISRGATI